MMPAMLGGDLRNGAALQDILTVLERRSPHTQVYVFPVAVQGEGAAEQVAAAVTQANQLTKTGAIPLDVLIVGAAAARLRICGHLMRKWLHGPCSRQRCPLCQQSAMRWTSALPT